MRYCANCGAENDNESLFCSKCGTKLADAAEEVKAEVAGAEAAQPAPTPVVPVAPVQSADQAQPYNNVQAQPYNNVQAQPAQDEHVKARVFGIIGFICGIISIVFCWLGVIPIAGIVSALFIIAHGIVGLIFCIKSQRELPNFTLAKLGKIFSIIGLSLSALLWIIGIIITASASTYYY